MPLGLCLWQCMCTCTWTCTLGSCHCHCHRVPGKGGRLGLQEACKQVLLKQVAAPGRLRLPAPLLHGGRSERAGRGRMFAGGYAGGPLSRKPSVHAETLQIPKGSGVRKSSSSGGKMLSMSYSESIRSSINRYHSDQGLSSARHADPAHQHRQREQRLAAQLRNMEDFLRMNGLVLEECVSFQTGMKYR
ncbi:hypothetical protein MATL_G00080590 [Megalops atlanticus]|uniref:Uncharacterized protein n=1 Tax=Megalops atlanticus TaxID=7932 RepID=A0A9D3Q7M6_MEGAT|nr:hypothetical protein MATL_G00080590 [Megalops atlanticus]